MTVGLNAESSPWAARLSSQALQGLDSIFVVRLNGECLPAGVLSFLGLVFLLVCSPEMHPDIRHVRRLSEELERFALFRSQGPQ